MTLASLARLREASSLADIRTCIEEVGAELGFPLFTYLYDRQEPGYPRHRHFQMNAPDAFTDLCLDPSASRRDPVAALLRTQTMPFIYDQGTYVSAKAGDLWEEQAVFGFGTGIATAVQISAGERLWLGFDRPERISASDDVRSALLDDLAAVASASARLLHRALASDEHFARSCQLSGQCGLPKRQLEVIYWAAHGHSNAEIASILRISADTVQGQLRSAQDRLGTTNRTEPPRILRRLLRLRMEPT